MSAYTAARVVLCSLIVHLPILVSVLPPLRLQELASPLRELGWRAHDHCQLLLAAQGATLNGRCSRWQDAKMMTRTIAHTPVTPVCRRLDMATSPSQRSLVALLDHLQG